MFYLTHAKEIELMITFRGRKIAKTETKYTYKSDDGAKLTFMADPNKEWHWKVYNNESNDKGIKLLEEIIKFHLLNI